jgi:hypothetical protein
MGTDGHDEANSRFRKFYERAYKFDLSPTQRIYVFYADLQNKPLLLPYKELTKVFFINRVGVCLLRGTTWVFK